MRVNTRTVHTGTKDVPLVEFMYVVFTSMPVSGGVYVLCIITRMPVSGGVYALCIITRMPSESYRRGFGCLLLYLCYVFRALINSFVS